jgi:hypothetical protein
VFWISLCWHCDRYNLDAKLRGNFQKESIGSIYPPYTGPCGLREVVFQRLTPHSFTQLLAEVILPSSLEEMIPTLPSSLNIFSSRNRTSSFSSDDSHPLDSDKPVPPPILIYHESARSIVFRDHLRRAKFRHTLSYDSNDGGESTKIVNHTSKIKPLPPLELTSKNEFTPLLFDIIPDDLSKAEQEVVDLFHQQYACVKTLRNQDWTAFLRRFLKPIDKGHDTRYPDTHDDIPPSREYKYNAFVTSTTLLPANGRKMRAYGSTNEYTTGVVFALPKDYGSNTECQVVERTKTWAWPSGYAAKTEFNIDDRGRLINGRAEALVTLKKLRSNNHDYLTKKDFEILGRTIKGGLKTVPYNEVYLRVGGVGQIFNGKDTNNPSSGCSNLPSLEHGTGLPVAFFVRTATYGHLITLLRTRARAAHVWGRESIKSTPLLFISPELGVRVLTQKLEQQLLQIAARDLNPFQNQALAYKTTIGNTGEAELQHKMEELIDIESDNIRHVLTPEERARLAGGFGATDESTVRLLMEAKRMDDDLDESHRGIEGKRRNHLQEIVNEGLASAVRSSDYHTARQLLILYSVVATKSEEIDCALKGKSDRDKAPFCDDIVKRSPNGSLQSHIIPSPPPPPPLDTDRLRSATNSDGLLAVLGAAQVLKAMQDGGAMKRVLECIGALDEWVEHGQNSVAFRLASWRDQHAAQADLKIAMENDSSFMAFISNKAIVNRKAFASKLKAVAAMASDVNMESVTFLQAIHDMVSRMHSPCLRLELLQFVLGLDNRFSVAHLARSVELAITCLSITTRSIHE